MIYTNIKRVELKLQKRASNYLPGTLAYLISEISSEICPVEDVLNINDEHIRCAPGYNKIGIGISGPIEEEQYYCVTLSPTIKAYNEEDEYTISISLFYQYPFSEDVFYRGDFYVDKEHWLFILHYFLSEVNNQQPIKITVDTHMDFVG